MAGTKPDAVSQWLVLALCVPMFGVGFCALLIPYRLQKAMISLSSRLPDQSRMAPFLRFISGKHFVWLLRLFSLFAIAMAIGLICTVE